MFVPVIKRANIRDMATDFVSSGIEAQKCVTMDTINNPADIMLQHRYSSINEHLVKRRGCFIFEDCLVNITACSADGGLLMVCSSTRSPVQAFEVRLDPRGSIICDLQALKLGNIEVKSLIDDARLCMLHGVRPVQKIVDRSVFVYSISYDYYVTSCDANA